MNLFIDIDKCTGCRVCEAACSFRKKNATQPSMSAITVAKWEKDGLNIPMVCFQCEKPICIEVCPVNALCRNSKTNAVVLDEKKCIGCRICVSSCPFGMMGFDDEKGVSSKCDLCDGKPECEKFCPYDAIELISDDKLAIKRRKQVVSKLSQFFNIMTGDK